MLRFKLHHLCAISLLVTALCHRPAQAMGVTFDLAVASKEIPTPAAASPKLDTPTLSPAALRSQPLPIPAAASRPPVRDISSKVTPSNVISSVRLLPPPPPEALPVARVLPPAKSLPAKPLPTVGLSFVPAQPAVEPPPKTPAATPVAMPPWIYEGGSNSLVARVIGSAEGTRSADGTPTRAYYGHTDPGNGVWNMGTFSYQHGAKSPDEADNKQLKRLQRQGKVIARQADQAQLDITLGEALNGLDLANQSPRAALEPGGYIDRLAEARQQGLQNHEAIVWARTYSYMNPDTQRWNAPGLGNTLPSIHRDQSRRHQAINRAFTHYHAQHNTAEPAAKSLTSPVMTVALQPSNGATPRETDQTNQPVAAIALSQVKPLEFVMAGSPAAQSNQENNTDQTAILLETDADLPQTENGSLNPDENSQAQFEPEAEIVPTPG
ncbi:MAG: hypothetical protein AAF282_12845 [Cyanobacteria bacterium P01_A01_bin.15]